jgi:hypothetical protein
MRAPITQEEIDYRTDLTNRLSAISNMQSIFSDVEDRGRKLAIVKSLFETLNYNTDIMSIIQDEIDAYEEQAKKEAEEAAKTDVTGDTGTDTESSETPMDDTSDNDLDLDLAPMPESLNQDTDIILDKTILIEDFEDTDDIEELLEEASEVLIEEDDLPSPDALGELDFTENK